MTFRLTTSISILTNDEAPLDEQYVQDAFHIFLQTSLDQARKERLLDVDVLSSAEGDLMIKGVSPFRSLFSSFSIVSGLALCLCFAALRCTTNPPSVALPLVGDTVRPTQRPTLSRTNCPSTLMPLMNRWFECVPTIQDLAPERTQELQHVICGLGPPTSPPDITSLSDKLRSIAIEISQRQSFQNRVKSTFVSPPPQYTPWMPLSAFSNTRESAKITGPTDPTIELIRETLYAALADVLENTPHLHAQLTLDPPRAYFGSVALAILGVSTRTSAADDMDGGVIWLVRDRQLTVAECPDMWRPLMREFVEIGVEAARIRESDTATAMTCAQEDREVPVPRLEIARMRLEHGAGYDEHQGEERDADRERSVVAFVNRVNTLALKMTQLPEFRARQDRVFEVLSAVGGA